MKRKILFVDDEEKILKGLERSLYSIKNEYDLFYVSSGNEALKLLEKEAVDIVVTDMRMPEMNGLELLQEIKKRYPEIVRIILSGYSEQDAVLKSIELTHQYLSKPCDIEVLKKTIKRSFEIRELLKEYHLRELVSKLVVIPSLPNLYLKLLGELASENISIEKISEIISQDMGMSVKILHIVNAHFFGIKKSITNITDALNLLGLDVIKSLVLSIDIFDKYNESPITDFSINELMAHSLIVAKISKKIALMENRNNIFINNAFLSGMLHDIGILIIASNLPQKYEEVIKIMNERKIDLNGAEKIILNATHSDIGAYLVKLWGLPDEIVEAVAYHHHPSECADKSFNILSVVHFANYLYHKKYSKNNILYNIPLDKEYYSMLGLAEKISVWENLDIDD